MSAEENKAVVRRSVEEGWNSGDVANVDQFYAADYVHHESAQPHIRDIEALKQSLLPMAAAFPDIQTTIEDLIAEGDKVVKRYTIRGTHRGEFQGIPPTGKQVTITGITIYRLAGGKIVEGW